MWRSDVTDPVDFDDADDDEVLKPSNRANNQQDTGLNSLRNEKEREERIVGDENILQGRRRKTMKHRLQTYGDREKFLPQIEWKRALFIACCQGNVPAIESIINEHPRAINQRIFDMGFQIGLGGAMRFLDCSAPLHVTCWSGKAPATRWLLNHGASPTLKDGLNQSPIEIARTNEVKQVLGAAKGIIALDDKVSRVEFQAAHTVAEMGSKLHTQLHRAFAELGTIEKRIDDCVRKTCKEEVKYLREDVRDEMKEDMYDFKDQLVKQMKKDNAMKHVQKIKKAVQVTNAKLNKLEKSTEHAAFENHQRLKDIENEQRKILENTRRKGEYDNSDAEVEAAGGAYYGGGDQRMKRTIAKLETKIQSLQRKVKKYEDHEDKFEDIQERLFHLENRKRTVICSIC